MTTLCHNQAGHNLNPDCCKNFKPRTLNTHTKLDSLALRYGTITVWGSLLHKEYKLKLECENRNMTFICNFCINVTFIYLTSICNFVFYMISQIYFFTPSLKTLQKLSSLCFHLCRNSKNYKQLFFSMDTSFHTFIYSHFVYQKYKKYFLKCTKTIVISTAHSEVT